MHSYHTSHSSTNLSTTHLTEIATSVLHSAHRTLGGCYAENGGQRQRSVMLVPPYASSVPDIS
eukprot:1132648-Rhodomonas_salina.1